MFLVINKGKVISYCIALCTVIAVIAVSSSIEKNKSIQTTSVQNVVIENNSENIYDSKGENRVNNINNVNRNSANNR